jgi:hypothetical protein
LGVSIEKGGKGAGAAVFHFIMRLSSFSVVHFLISLTGACVASVEIGSTTPKDTLGYYVYIYNGSYSGVTLNCVCTDEGSGDPGSGTLGGCFSESAEVETENRGTVTMKELEVGDRVFSGFAHDMALYQPVYSFGHYQDSTEITFLRIYTDRTARMPPLEITGEHLVFSVGPDSQRRTIPANALKKGDFLVQEDPSNGSPHHARVTKISSIKKKGAYMPLTPDGTLVVNGLRVSSYVSIQDEAPSVVHHSYLLAKMTEENLSHWWLSPFRMLCMGVSSKFCAKKTADSFSNDEGTLDWFLVGRKVAEFFDEHSFVVHVIVTVPLLFIFGSLVLVESLFGPHLAPTAVAMIGTGLLAVYWRMHKVLGRNDLAPKKVV